SPRKPDADYSFCRRDLSLLRPPFHFIGTCAGRPGAPSRLLDSSAGNAARKGQGVQRVAQAVPSLLCKKRTCKKKTNHFKRRVPQSILKPPGARSRSGRGRF